MNTLKYLILLLIIPLLSGCSEEMQRNLKSVPSAFGKINEIVVIADRDLWDGDLGDSSESFPL